MAFIELAMKWVIVALKHWEIGVALPQASVFCMNLLGEEKLGDAKYWGGGGGKEGYSQNKGGVALHHQLLSSKDLRIAKKRRRKDLYYLLKGKKPIKKNPL